MVDGPSGLDEQVIQTPVGFDSRTLRLLELLSAKSKELASMLRGAWIVLSTTDNPDVLPQAAHSIRELMEKAPIKLPEVPVQQGSNTLKSDVMALGTKWAVVAQARQSEVTWSGEIDEPLRNILNDFGVFFSEFSSKYQPRNEQNSALIQALDGSGVQIPAQLLRTKLKQWNGLRDYFLSVAHHGKPNATREEVTEAIASLEEFLLNLISPEPIPELDELDKLIAEGESA